MTRLKIKNLIVQLIVLTPLSIIHSVLFWAMFVFLYTYEEHKNEVELINVVFAIILIIVFMLIISKIITWLKGHEIDDYYWDKDFEYEIYFDTSGHVNDIKQTKGGWTHFIPPIVYLHLILSPINIALQLISLIFAIVSLFSRHILSYYGALDYDECAVIPIQIFLHYCFNFIIV